METKTILIVGAGIGGLSLAIILKSLNIPFEIIEKQKHWTKKGLAMAIQGEGLAAAEKTGILDNIESHGTPRNLERIEDNKGKLIKQIQKTTEEKSFVIPRDILHEELRSRVADISMNKEITDIKEHSDRADVKFTTGETDSFGLIVGADGINSITRNLINNKLQFLHNKKDILYSGSVLWGITVDKKYNEIIEVWDNRSMCAMYPVKSGTVFSFFRNVPETFYSSKRDRAEDIKKYFSSYSQPTIKEVLENLPENIFFDRVRYSRPALWSKGRITLIVDASHSLSPLSGLGANLAMADAEGLSNLIKNHLNDGKFLSRLDEFNRKRKILADKAYRLSKMRTKRGMLGFPETLIRNNKIKQSYWKY